MRMVDLTSVQHVNYVCLAENFRFKYAMYHLLAWPQISFVAEDVAKGTIIGYCLAKMDEDDFEVRPLGYITSLAVHRQYRRRGIATLLMEQTIQAMISVFNTPEVTLHVRVTNAPAIVLYTKMNFKEVCRDPRYYFDGEDGILMKLDLLQYALLRGVQPADRGTFFLKIDLKKMIRQQDSLKSDDSFVAEELEKLSLQMKENDRKKQAEANCEFGPKASTSSDALKAMRSEASSPSSSTTSTPTSTPTSTATTTKRTRSEAEAAGAARWKARKEDRRNKRKCKESGQDETPNRKPDPDDEPDEGATGCSSPRVP